MLVPMGANAECEGDDVGEWLYIYCRATLSIPIAPFLSLDLGRAGFPEGLA